jgi:hypothetical protein
MEDVMTYEKLKLTKAVTYARLLGFEPHTSYKHPRRHFQFNTKEDTFSISFFATGTNYCVNRQNTSSEERACEWLQEIERKQKQTASPEWEQSIEWLRENKNKLTPDATR